MKLKLVLFIAPLLILFSFNTHAQVNITVNVNTLPEWAPKKYVPDTRYYYIPELGLYYDIPSRMYIYKNKKGWVRDRRLPKQFVNYNLNNCYKVSLYDIGPNPYAHYNSHTKRYPKNYRKGLRQPTRYDAPNRNNMNDKRNNSAYDKRSPKDKSHNHINKNNRFNR